MSAIRLTGGTARGRVLRTPVAKGVRPTSARVREAFFSIVGQDLSGTTFLDAFGGAGVMGLEAASRGAAVTVVEKNRRVARDIQRRAAEIGLCVDVLVGDVTRLAGDLPDTFTLVFADPPYAMEPGPVLAMLGRCGEQLFLETATRTTIPDSHGLLHRGTRRYGDTSLHHFERDASRGR